MRHADLVGFLFRILPFEAWKDALLRGHIENCPACRGRLASREEARRAIFRSEDMGIPGGFWPAIAERIDGCALVLEPVPAPAPAAGTARGAETIPGPRRWAWRWAAVVSGTALAALLTFALVRYLSAPAPGTTDAAGATDPESDQVQIHYVRIDNAPAQTFIFKPHDSDVVIVWAGKNI
jgi:hypothetical protein